MIAPFFTSFLIRTLAWKTILADDGWLVETLKFLHLMGQDGHLLATPIAVVIGLTYNFLPFMVLPLYASLERIDPRLIEAGGRPLRHAVHDLPQGDLPAVHARRRRRHAADLHPGGR